MAAKITEIKELLRIVRKDLDELQEEKEHLWRKRWRLQDKLVNLLRKETPEKKL